MVFHVSILMLIIFTSSYRDTYSESWTSARLEGSKFKVDNIPFQNADKPSDASSTSDSESETANKKEELDSSDCELSVYSVITII